MNCHLCSPDVRAESQGRRTRQRHRRASPCSTGKRSRSLLRRVGAEKPIHAFRLDFVGVDQERWRAVALSYLYAVFVRMLQLFRLRGTEQDQSAIEVVMLRDQVSVLRRRVARPVLRPADRVVLAGLSRWCRRFAEVDRWCSPKLCFAGIGTWSGADVRTSGVALAGRQYPRARSSGCLASPRGARHGALGEPAASWPRWDCTSHPRAYGRSCGVTASAFRRGGRVRPGPTS